MRKMPPCEREKSEKVMHSRVDAPKSKNTYLGKEETKIPDLLEKLLLAPLCPIVSPRLHSISKGGGSSAANC